MSNGVRTRQERCTDQERELAQRALAADHQPARDLPLLIVRGHLERALVLQPEVDRHARHGRPRVRDFPGRLRISRISTGIVL